MNTMEIEFVTGTGGYGVTGGYGKSISQMDIVCVLRKCVACFTLLFYVKDKCIFDQAFGLFLLPLSRSAFVLTRRYGHLQQIVRGWDLPGRSSRDLAPRQMLRRRQSEGSQSLSGTRSLPYMVSMPHRLDGDVWPAHDVNDVLGWMSYVCGFDACCFQLFEFLCEIFDDILRCSRGELEGDKVCYCHGEWRVEGGKEATRLFIMSGKGYNCTVSH